MNNSSQNISPTNGNQIEQVAHFHSQIIAIAHKLSTISQDNSPPKLLSPHQDEEESQQSPASRHSSYTSDSSQADQGSQLASIHTVKHSLSSLSSLSSRTQTQNSPTSTPHSVHAPPDSIHTTSPSLYHPPNHILVLHNRHSPSLLRPSFTANHSHLQSDDFDVDARIVTTQTDSSAAIFTNLRHQAHLYVCDDQQHNFTARHQQEQQEQLQEQRQEQPPPHPNCHQHHVKHEQLVSKQLPNLTQREIPMNLPSLSTSSLQRENPQRVRSFDQNQAHAQTPHYSEEQTRPVAIQPLQFTQLPSSSHEDDQTDTEEQGGEASRAAGAAEEEEEQIEQITDPSLPTFPPIGHTSPCIISVIKQSQHSPIGIAYYYDNSVFIGETDTETNLTLLCQLLNPNCILTHLHPKDEQYQLLFGPYLRFVYEETGQSQPSGTHSDRALMRGGKKRQLPVDLDDQAVYDDAADNDHDDSDSDDFNNNHLHQDHGYLHNGGGSAASISDTTSIYHFPSIIYRKCSSFSTEQCVSRLEALNINNISWEIMQQLAASNHTSHISSSYPNQPIDAAIQDRLYPTSSSLSSSSSSLSLSSSAHMTAEQQQAQSAALLQAMKWGSLIDFNKVNIIMALSGLLCYVLQHYPVLVTLKNQRHIFNSGRTAPSFITLHPIPTTNTLACDEMTRSSLCIFTTDRTPNGLTKEGLSLYTILRHTKTQYGAKLLRHRLLFPITDHATLIERLDHVEFCSQLQHQQLIHSIRLTLSQVKNIYLCYKHLHNMTAQWHDFLRILKFCEAYVEIHRTLRTFFAAVYGLRYALQEPSGSTMHSYDSAHVSHPDGPSNNNNNNNTWNNDRDMFPPDQFSSIPPSSSAYYHTIDDPMMISPVSFPQFQSRPSSSSSHDFSQGSMRFDPPPTHLSSSNSFNFPLPSINNTHNPTSQATSTSTFQSWNRAPPSVISDQDISEENLPFDNTPRVGLENPKHVGNITSSIFQHRTTEQQQSSPPPQHHQPYPNPPCFPLFVSHERDFTATASAIPNSLSNHPQPNHIAIPRLFAELASDIHPEFLSISQLLSNTLDVSRCQEEKRIVLKPQCDPQLWQLGQNLDQLDMFLSQMLVNDIRQGDAPYLPRTVSKYVYIPYRGFFLSLTMLDDSGNPMTTTSTTMTDSSDVFIDNTVIEHYNLTFISSPTPGELYFTSPRTETFVTEIGDLYVQLRLHEHSIILQLVEMLLQYAPLLTSYAQRLYEIDVACALGLVAAEFGLVRPELTSSRELIIHNAKHLLLDVVLATISADGVEAPPPMPLPLPQSKTSAISGSKTSCIPNSITINDNSNRVNIITGPNKSGKSIFLATVGMLVYLAHIGCFVPASYARIGICDRIVLYHHSPDSLQHSLSTFASDLSHISRACLEASSHSLLLFDEFGVGTLPMDAIALFVGLVKYFGEMHPVKSPKVLLTTHFHEILTFGLLQQTIQIRFYSMQCAYRTVLGSSSSSSSSLTTTPSSLSENETIQSIVYFYHLIPGWDQNNAIMQYGLLCAQHAGIPTGMVQRARDIISILQHQTQVSGSSSSSSRKTLSSDPHFLLASLTPTSCYQLASFKPQPTEPAPPPVMPPLLANEAIYRALLKSTVIIDLFFKLTPSLLPIMQQFNILCAQQTSSLQSSFRDPLLQPPASSNASLSDVAPGSNGTGLDLNTQHQLIQLRPLYNFVAALLKCMNSRVD